VLITKGGEKKKRGGSLVTKGETSQFRIGCQARWFKKGRLTGRKKKRRKSLKRTLEEKGGEEYIGGRKIRLLALPATPRKRRGGTRLAWQTVREESCIRKQGKKKVKLDR